MSTLTALVIILILIVILQIPVCKDTIYNTCSEFACACGEALGVSKSSVSSAFSDSVTQDNSSSDAKYIENMIVRGVDDPREVVLETDYVPSIQYDEVSGSGNTYGVDPGYKYGPFHDLDPDFVSSRERMGACSGTMPCGKNRSNMFSSIDTTSLGTRNDDIYDGDRCAAMGLYPCTENTPRTALSLMYKDVMGLPNPEPSAEDCEYRAVNGYIYKDQC
jgi:hypothetical protein